MVLTKNVYIVLVKKEDRKLVFSSKKAHSGILEYAVDFALPEGTEILAARGGKVVGVHVNSNEGGTDKKYWKDPWGFVNWITIEHENGELSQYFHLKFNGSIVKVGDYVNVGDIIGYSGNTGLSSEPHLHFHVIQELNTDVGWETMKINFNENIKIYRTLKEVYSAPQK